MANAMVCKPFISVLANVNESAPKGDTWRFPSLAFVIETGVGAI